MRMPYVEIIYKITYYFELISISNQNLIAFTKTRAGFCLEIFQYYQTFLPLLDIYCQQHMRCFQEPHFNDNSDLVCYIFVLLYVFFIYPFELQLFSNQVYNSERERERHKYKYTYISKYVHMYTHTQSKTLQTYFEHHP